MNIYSNPENFGLTLINEIDFSSGSYEFDITAVWRRNSDGALVYADDAGCSCPGWFEGQTEKDVTTTTPADLQAHLEQRAKAAYADYSDDRWAMQIANLMALVIA